MLNYVDVAICLILFISVSIGIYKGFVKETLSLASLILALFLAFYLSGYPVQWLMPVSQNWGGEWLGFNIEGESIVFVVSFILIFIVSLVFGNLLGNSLSNLVSQSTILKGMNRVLGAAFGLARGAIIVMLLVIVAGLTKVSIYNWWHQSHLLPPFIDGAQRIVAMLPTQYSWHFDFGMPDAGTENSMELSPTPRRQAEELQIYHNLNDWIQ